MNVLCKLFCDGVLLSVCRGVGLAETLMLMLTAIKILTVYEVSCFFSLREFRLNSKLCDIRLEFKHSIV